MASSAAVLAGVLLLAPLAGPLPAADGEDAPFLTDPAGDPVAATLGESTPPLPGPGRERSDLLALDVEETADHLRFVFLVSQLEEKPSGDTIFRVWLTWGEDGWLVKCYRYYLGEGATYCYLLGATTSRLPSVADPSAGTLAVEVPKSYLVDASGRCPDKGDVVEVRSQASFHVQDLAGFQDLAPDAGTAPFTLTIGDVAEGSLALTTPMRVRVSNGGATTLVFQADLTNGDAQEHVVELATEGLPEGWTMRAPDTVDARPGVTPLVLLVGTPFGHEHGGFTNFTLHARSRADPASHATLRLGVLHSPVPQPAGHHDTLHLHPPAPWLFEGLARPPPYPMLEEAIGGPYTPPPVGMSTSDDHEGERNWAYASEAVEGGVRWVVALEPGLGIGLDFRLEEPARLDGAIRDALGGSGTLTARLLLVPEAGAPPGAERTKSYDLDAARVLSEGEVALVAGPGADAAFSLELPVAAWADVVPPATAQNLVLELRWLAPGVGERCCDGDLAPWLLAEPFLLQLPLEEYHDALGDVGEVGRALQLRAEGPAERVGRPGTTVTYWFRLQNDAGAPLTVDLQAAGLHADTAEVTPTATTLAPGAAARVGLAVRVPAAADGQALEVLLQAVARDDPTRTALARTLTTVGRGAAAAPDEAEAFAMARDEGRETPAPGAALALLLLSMLAFSRRPRRQP